ncbi:MAG TPA: PCYCGC motif-containing (lipo)protein [Longimicrobiales bacterium]|nr:PCYCGC motif-containing (lipo)protein [Longimicrobiales bacterium]
MAQSSSICRPRDQRGDALARNRSAEPSRRAFLRLLAAGVSAAPFLQPDSVYAGLRRAQTPHPEPRPGIDGSRVLTAEQLADAPELIELYDGIREIPQIVDGIRCYCGCAHLEGYRSLLTCFEESGMPKHCDICRDQGRLAVNRSKEGQSLAQIRRATDARFGPGSVAPAAASHEHESRRRMDD